MGVITVAALLFVSYSCTCRLGLSQSGLGPTLNGMFISIITYKCDDHAAIKNGSNLSDHNYYNNLASASLSFSVILCKIQKL